jgi:CRISPR-associated endonuclease/helicase Cas3
MSKRCAPLAFVVAGHHGGLSNKQDLITRLQAKQEYLEVARKSGLPAALESLTPPNDLSCFSETGRAMWTRFLFSALVDADYLDTEAFFEGAEREMPPVDLAPLAVALDQYLDEKSARSEETGVNCLRRRVLSDCRTAATLPRGFFSLTVPTGGGKTLSSLSFALRHAVEHKLRRVIFVVPFTSIIDQTVKVYREIFGDDLVVEHHSSLDPDKESKFNQTACENWDGGIIVTTAVQFFESLYANKPSRCRKLHRIADSVVLFDEVQTFEPSLLEPIKEALRNLVWHFGVSAVFCTATQPPLGLGAREIVQDVRANFAVVQARCRVRLPESEQPVTWAELAAELRNERQALAIVDRRADAEELARLTGEPCIHLSARMCPAHRLETIAQVKDLLIRGERCVVVSTQLVEAGVDLDFPVVYRAFAGAGSMAQAAGRCNREGKLAESGELRVFVAPKQPPRGMLRIGFERAKGMWKEGILELGRPDTFTVYYERFYRLLDADPGVLAAERDLRFADSASLFNLIDDVGEQIVAPYRYASDRVREIEYSGVTRLAMRRLQPFLVTLYRQEVEALRRAGAVAPIAEGVNIWQVLPQFPHVYSERFGFQWQGEIAAEPESLVR